MTTASHTTLTPEQARRISAAIADCDRYIAKEEGRSADLRPLDVQKRLDWYRAHRVKLQGMLGGVK